jgi:predicted RNA-binding Zn ribbon-like protein
MVTSTKSGSEHTTSSEKHAVTHDEPALVGDHPALDFLNTVSMKDGSLVDSLQSDGDILDWLGRAGFPVESGISELRPSSLLRAAHALRETIRTLVEKCEAGKRADPEALNAFLADARSYMKLVQKKDGSLQLNRKWKQRNAAEILAPLAESAADLLANGDFSLIRRCEDAECVLWFYDRTKSHHRRWCSMATCGNRHKVAAFRKRRQES